MEADKTAYDEIYLEDVIDLHTLLFIKLTEITEYDLCSMIDVYMQHSEIRRKMDVGNWSALNKGYKQLKNSIDFSLCAPRKEAIECDRILLNWISQMYVRLQWKYCIASAEISRAIPSALLMRLYDPLHETSYNNACPPGDQLCGNRFFHKPVTGFFTFTGSQIPADQCPAW